jgi:hypothetical protein
LLFLLVGLIDSRRTRAREKVIRAADIRRALDFHPRAFRVSAAV